MLITRAFNKIRAPQGFNPLLNGVHVEEYEMDGDSPPLNMLYAPFSEEQFFNGTAPEDWVRQVFDNLDKATEERNRRIRELNKRRRKQVAEEPYKSAFVAEYAPFALTIKDTLLKKTLIMPAFGVAMVDRNCALTPCLEDMDTAFPPPLWLIRKYFRPHHADVELDFGDFAHYSRAVQAWSPDASWTSLIELFANSWYAATGQAWEEWLDAGHYALHRGWIREGRSDTATFGIVKMYEELLGQVKFDAPEVGLFKGLCTGEAGPEWSQRLEAQAVHLGQMDNTHGLMPSQRAAVRAAVATKNGESLAVNGPPGTGKTTLLQSVVADLMVRSMLSAQPNPPLIVACAATNQAITNILEAFANASAQNQESENPLDRRWIRNLESFGVYCKAKSRRRKEWPHQMLVLDPGVDLAPPRRLPDGRSDPKVSREAEAILQESLYGEEVGFGKVLEANSDQTAVAWWEEEASRWLGRSVTLPDGMRELKAAVKVVAECILSCERVLAEADRMFQMPGRFGHDEKLRNLADRMAPYIAEGMRAAAGGFAEDDATLRKAWFGILRESYMSLLDSDYALDSIKAGLDMALRRPAFALAARWWEGQFIRIVASQQFAWWDSRNRKEAFRMIACVAPCMVATFDKIGSVFTRWDGYGPRVLWGEADLLIIDEAGQAGPDRAAASFGIAKRALVVGDTKQLPPVEGEDAPFFTMEIAEECGVNAPEMRAKGLLCGTSFDGSNQGSAKGSSSPEGSIMRAASSVSSFRSSAKLPNGQPVGPGMWLFDHFRCEPRIIKYSNDNWYGGLLVPRTQLRDDARLEVMSHINVVGDSQTSGGSRKNQTEARRVVKWLLDECDALESEYNLPLDRIVAVVTPFRAQAREIRHLLKNSPLREYAKYIVCNTVHALQGAERPVVLFSTVYSDGDFQDDPDAEHTYFFDRQATLLNVAVSRAKHSFIVIGDRRVFERSRYGTPTWRLGPHLGIPVREEPTAISARPERKSLQELLAETA